MPTEKEIAMIYRAASLLKEAHAMHEFDDAAKALQHAFTILPVDIWVWKLRSSRLLEGQHSFTNACILLDVMSEDASHAPIYNFNQKGFIEQLSDILTDCVEGLKNAEQIRWDGEVVFIDFIEDAAAPTCRVWRYDFAKVDAGKTDDPDEVELMRI